VSRKQKRVIIPITQPERLPIRVPSTSPHNHKQLRGLRRVAVTLFVARRLSWASSEFSSVSGQRGHMVCGCCWGVPRQIVMRQPRERRGYAGRWLSQQAAGFFSDPVVTRYSFAHGWGVGSLAVVGCMTASVASVASLRGCIGAACGPRMAGSSGNWQGRHGWDFGKPSALDELFLSAHDGLGQVSNETYEREAKLYDPVKKCRCRCKGGYYKLYNSLHLGFGGQLCFSLFQLFMGYLLVQSTLVMKSETASALILA